MRIIDKVQARESFTPTENTIAMYLQSNTKDVIDLSLDELAQTLFVSKSSVIRFCKKMGFKGHKELCVQLAKEMDTLIYQNERLDPSFPFAKEDDAKVIMDKTYALYSGALSQIHGETNEKTIQKMAQVIAEKKNLYIYVTNAAFFLAKNLEMQLNDIGFSVKAVVNTGNAVHTASMEDKNSAALFIAQEVRNEGFLKAVQILNEKNVPVLLISCAEKIALSSYADETISISYYEPKPKCSTVGTRVSLMYVLDVLYACLFQIDYEKRTQFIKNVYNEEFKTS